MAWYDSIRKLFVKEEIADRSRKSPVQNGYYGGYAYYGKTTGEPSPVPLSVIADHYNKDPVVQAAISTRVNAILSTGYTNNGSKTAVKNSTEKLKKIGFDYQFLELVVVNSILYEHLFIEIERDGNGSAVGLHVMETPFMEIVHDEYGVISKFVQRNENGSVVEFPPEDVVYVKFNSVRSGVWGYTGLTSLYRTLTTKNEIEKFLNSLAVTNAWRQVFKTTMSDDKIPVFLAYLDDVRADPTIPFVMQEKRNPNDPTKNETNKFELLRDPSDLKEFLGVLDYLRTQVLMELKVPPIMIGLPDSSNRSNSDSQIKAFNMANEAVRKKLSFAINNDLYSKIGVYNTEFSWNPIDERSEKDDIEIAERLINMGAKPKMVEQFLRNSGLELPEGELFDSDSIVQKKSMDLYPSRKGKADGESNNKIGSGIDSTTRQDQL